MFGENHTGVVFSDFSIQWVKVKGIKFLKLSKDRMNKIFDSRMSSDYRSTQTDIYKVESIVL